MAFHLDPERPYQITLGRGSGLYGLNTMKVTQDGAADLCRAKEVKEGEVWRTIWEKTTLKLSPDAVARVLASVENNRLLALDKMYSDPSIADGTPWVLRVQQGANEKAVYFNNSFFSQIGQFAVDLDRVLAENGLGGAEWRPAPDARLHDRELWDSIK